MNNCLIEYFGLEDKVERHDCANCPFKNKKNCWKKNDEVRDRTNKKFHDYLYSMNREKRRKLTIKEKYQKYGEIQKEVIKEVVKGLKEDDLKQNQ